MNYYSSYSAKELTRIAQFEHKVSPIATVEWVANWNETSVTSNEFDILNYLKGGALVIKH